MSYTVSIRNNQTNEVRETVENLEWHEHSVFWWTEGNMGCDCNRHLEFERAKNPKFYEESECGNTRYTLLSITLEDGKVINFSQDS